MCIHLLFSNPNALFHAVFSFFLLSCLSPYSYLVVVYFNKHSFPKTFKEAGKEAAAAKTMALIVECGGPQIGTATKTDDVRLHDDKSTYTGVYAKGGPTNVDNKITLSNLGKNLILCISRRWFKNRSFSFLPIHPSIHPSMLVLFRLFSPRSISFFVFHVSFIVFSLHLLSHALSTPLVPPYRIYVWLLTKQTELCSSKFSLFFSQFLKLFAFRSRSIGIGCPWPQNSIAPD